MLRPTPRRRLSVTLAAAVLLVGGCAAQVNYEPLDAAALPDVAVVGDAPEELAFSTGATASSFDDDASSPEADAGTEPDAPSTEFCQASANIWSHSAALNMLGSNATPEMTDIAVANVAQWLERASLYDEAHAPERADMFADFQALTATLEADWDSDWQHFQQSSEYASDPAAQGYEAGRSDLVGFLSEWCDSVRLADLQADAEVRAEELRNDFAVPQGTVTESDSLPGHAIFTHGSGRLIASFPVAWDYAQDLPDRSADAIVQFVASPDIDRFLSGEAIDGVHLQLVEAADLDSFRSRIDQTLTASSCLRTNDLSDRGAVRLNITQTYACTDHGASIIGQFNPDRGLGLIIEAAFDRPDASRADLTRLASIANSALWS